MAVRGCSQLRAFASFSLRVRIMDHSMRELMTAGFRARHPDWSEAQIKKTVAERILHARTG
jgi:hypothetical protein